MTSHTFSPELDKRAERLAGAALLLAAITAIIAFFPVEGRIMVLLHDAFNAVLGRTLFLVPLGLALTGALGLACRARPDIVLPRRRLVGLALIALALLPSERTLGESTGLVGSWLTGFLIELLGGPLTVALIALLIGTGALLAFDIKIKLKRMPPVAAR